MMNKARNFCDSLRWLLMSWRRYLDRKQAHAFTASFAAEWQDFPPHILKEPVAGLAVYPEKDFQAAPAGAHAYISMYPEYAAEALPVGAHAYTLLFLVDTVGAERTKRLIAHSFPENIETQPAHRLAKNACVRAGNSQGERINYTEHEEFGGVWFWMRTNSPSFLFALDALHTVPPPPWVSFPWEDPKDALLPKLGPLWWHSLWKPFWTTLTEEEQHAYLKAHDASPEWVECLWMWHYEIPRTLKEFGESRNAE